MALSRDRSIDQVGPYLALAQIGIDGAASVIYEGAMVCALSATGYGVLAGTASTGAVLGVANFQVDNSAGADGAKSLDILQGLFWRPNSSGNAVDQSDYGLAVYAEDDQTISTDSGQPVAGICMGVDATQGVLVLIHPELNYLLSQATLETDLANVANGEGASKVALEDAAGNVDAVNLETGFAEIFTLLAGVTGTTGGNLLGYDDSGSKTAQTTIAGVLDEQLVDMTSAYAFIDIPFDNSWYEIDGTALAAFAGGASNIPGLALDNSEAAGVRWNNSGTPDPICKTIPIPWDLDETADIVASVVASKSGATLGDAVTWLIGAFNNVVGALSDADVDYGGTSAAMTGDATAKMVQSVDLILALANLPDPDAAFASMTVTIQPTDGTLGTDDVTAHALRLRYKRKLRTS